MRSPGGYAIWTSPTSVVERDTFTCKHCNGVVFVKPGPKDDSGGFCMKCFANICGRCADLGRCTPFEKRLEAMERDITARVEHERALERALKDTK